MECGSSPPHMPYRPAHMSHGCTSPWPAQPPSPRPRAMRVLSDSGHTYDVDTELGTCTCPDYRYRHHECKHLKGIRMTLEKRDDTHAELLSAVLIDGDLSRLTPEQRVDYYSRVCDSLGLNPLTQPFAVPAAEQQARAVRPQRRYGADCGNDGGSLSTCNEPVVRRWAHSSQGRGLWARWQAFIGHRRRAHRRAQGRSAGERHDEVRDQGVPPRRAPPRGPRHARRDRGRDHPERKVLDIDHKASVKPWARPN